MNQESTPLPTAQEELPRVRAFREAKEKAVAATLEALTIGGPARERAADEACRYLVNHFHEWMQPPAAIVASQGAGGGDRRVLQEALADLDATSWECQRCGHSEDCGTMDVAHAIRDHLAATPSEEQREIARLNAIINTPHADDFLRAVSIEAEHQRQRWGNSHDAGKEPSDWFLLVGYLGGKALHAHAAGNTEKAEHHVITTAAACANWHRAIFGKTEMRPGIDGEAALASRTAAAASKEEQSNG